MTRNLQGEDVSRRILQQFPGMDVDWDRDSFWVEPHTIRDIAAHLKNDPSLAFNYLNSITAVDYVDHFELVYHLTSFEHNHAVVMKAKIYGRDEPEVPSVVAVWPGANFQEREIWDLMGVRFEGHPNHKRIMLWEGFPGHPHRKDFEDVVNY